MQDFVEDWLIYNTILGEGAYGEVKLVVSKKTGEKVACKIIEKKKYVGAEQNIRREITVHSMLNHENIIKYYGLRREPDRVYMFLEYAAGGELFQQIEPGIGIPYKDAQCYMRQLMRGVDYIHSKGVTHRDIKPENILLNDSGVVKISDFGLATIFKIKNRERLLDKKCGTKPYLAPEILAGPYKAQPADIWSCGCVLVALLSGELLWNLPSKDNEDFQMYVTGNYLSCSPWNRLSTSALSLVRQMLEISPKKRITVEQIFKHPWMKCGLPLSDSESAGSSSDKQSLRWSSMMEPPINRETPHVTLSQPNMIQRCTNIDELRNDFKRVKRDNICFSQPTYNEDLIVSSQLQFTEVKLTKENFKLLIKRMTRLFVKTSCEKAAEKLCSVLDSFHYPWSLDKAGAITISTTDNMKNDLVFKVNIIEMENKVLLDFRLTKGCGIDFKRKFLKLKDCLTDIADND